MGPEVRIHTPTGDRPPRLHPVHLCQEQSWWWWTCGHWRSRRSSCHNLWHQWSRMSKVSSQTIRSVVCLVYVSQQKLMTIWLPGHSGWVTCVELTHDCSHLVSGSKDSYINIWDSVNGELLSRLKQDVEITCLTMYPLLPNDRLVKSWQLVNLFS